MDANEAKLLLQSYLRYKRNYLGVASEYCYAPSEIEDIVAFDEKEIIAVEIKISKNDFLRDFKKPKHTRLENPYHKFYFFVPCELKDFVLEYLKNNGYKSYGVISTNSKGEVYIAQSAKILKGSEHLPSVFHSDRIDELKRLIFRMSSEIIIGKSDLKQLKIRKKVEK